MNTEPMESKTPVQRIVMPLLHVFAALIVLLVLLGIVFGLPLLFVVWIWSWCPWLSVLAAIMLILIWCDADEYFDMPSHV